MQLTITGYGAYIRKRGECFEIKVDDKKDEISARRVQSILITTAALISSDALHLAYEHNIDVIFLDKYGKPFSRVWHAKFGSTTYIRRKQLEFSQNRKGLDLAKSWIITKTDNQIRLLEKLKRTRPKKREKIEAYVKNMTRYQEQLKTLDADSINTVRDEIFILEAHCAKQYFKAVNYIMPARYQFDGRSRQPAKDEFNAFLNYSYGVLYSRTERACILAGLDPYIGFLHTDNYGKKSFVFDIIELFRIYADEVVIRLFAKRMVKKEMVRQIKNGVTLVKTGKQLLIYDLNEALDEKIRYRGRNIKKKNIMQYECHRLANSFIGRDKEITFKSI